MDVNPLQLIQLLKEYLQKDLEKWEEKDKKEPHKLQPYPRKKFNKISLRFLYEILQHLRRRMSALP